MKPEETFQIELYHGDMVTRMTTSKADMDRFFIDLRGSHFARLESVNSTAVLILSSDFKFMKIAKKQQVTLHDSAGTPIGDRIIPIPTPY